ncbi:Hint domain-containing protein [Cellulomonas sp. S1-8]|nr:Hint domain-containing protein [Cellulomonas sp. S1-8]UZN02627.1 Hint domain-containing protein [Cellulomonas sp. S1-8]
MADIPKWNPKVVPDSAAIKQANTAAEQARAAANQSRTVASRTSREVDDAKRANDQARKAAENKKSETCNSFVPGTGVVMADGSVKAIDDVAVGDTVVAVAADGSRTHRQVVATITGHGAKDLVGLTLVGSGGGGPPADETITATDGHLFLTADGEWVPAKDLHVGDQLVDPDGTPVSIAAIDHDSVVATVHNLTVDTDHTYTVVTAGRTDVVTHNDNLPRRKGLRDTIQGAQDAEVCPAQGKRPSNLSPVGAGRSGALNQAKRDSGVPASMSPTRTLPNLDRRGMSSPGGCTSSIFLHRVVVRAPREFETTQEAMSSPTTRRRIEGRISTRRTVRTMITSTMRITRETLDSWPALQAAALGDSYGVMSFDVPGADHEAGVSAAAAEFAAVVADVGARLASSSWVLIARLGSVDVSNRLAARRLQLSGPWQLPGVSAFSGLAGEKRWWHEDEGDGRARVYGHVEIARSNIAEALVASRALDSVLIGSGDQTPVSLGSVGGDRRKLFEIAAAMLLEGARCVARTYGEFDDASAGVDVVASMLLLDRCEVVLREHRDL